MTGLNCQESLYAHLHTKFKILFLFQMDITTACYAAVCQPAVVVCAHGYINNDLISPMH